MHNAQVSFTLYIGIEGQGQKAFFSKVKVTKLLTEGGNARK